MSSSPTTSATPRYKVYVTHTVAGRPSSDPTTEVCASRGSSWLTGRASPLRHRHRSKSAHTSVSPVPLTAMLWPEATVCPASWRRPWRAGPTGHRRGRSWNSVSPRTRRVPVCAVSCGRSRSRRKNMYGTLTGSARSVGVSSPASREHSAFSVITSRSWMAVIDVVAVGGAARRAEAGDRGPGRMVGGAGERDRAAVPSCSCRGTELSGPVAFAMWFGSLHSMAWNPSLCSLVRSQLSTPVTGHRPAGA